MDRKKVIFAIVKEIEQGNKAFTFKDLDLEEKDFNECFELAINEGYIKDVYFADNIPHYEIARVTMKGIDYLEENSTLAKTYRGLKEFRNWLPF